MGGSRCRTTALILLALATATPAVAARWRITPEITVRETYNDNPALAARPARGDFITQVTPALRVAGSGARVQADLNFAPSAIFHARNTRQDSISNSLAASGRLEALENRLFVEASGHISQHFVSPVEPRPPEITTATGNRTETRTFGISPYIRGELARDFAYELRNRGTWTSTDNPGLSDVRTTQWSGRVASPIRLFGWALEFDDSRTGYDLANRPEQKARLHRARLFLQPEPSVRLSASAGREENNFGLQPQRGNDLYGAGVSWTPTPRTTVGLEWERRFFGASRVGRFTHRTRLTAWNLAYSRSDSSFQREILRLPPGDTAALLDAIFAARITDPLQRQAAVEQFLRAADLPPFLANPLAFYTEQVFVREGLEASMGLLGRRNSVTFTVFSAENRSLPGGTEARLPDAFLLATRITQHGFGLRGDHRLAPFTSVGASATRTYSRQEGPGSVDTRNDYFALSLTHTLSPKTRAFAGLSVSNFSSTDPGAGRKARSAFVGVHHRF